MIWLITCRQWSIIRPQHFLFLDHDVAFLFQRLQGRGTGATNLQQLTEPVIITPRRRSPTLPAGSGHVTPVQFPPTSPLSGALVELGFGSFHQRHPQQLS